MAQIRQEVVYQQRLTEIKQLTGIDFNPKLRETRNLIRNFSKALIETMKHVCDPKTTKAKDNGKNSLFTPTNLSAEERAKIDQLSYSELLSNYSSVISSYRTYLGTGYHNPLGSPKNRYIISKYNELKAVEDVKAAQALAEVNKYHYKNYYRTIDETGLRPDGTPASDLEKEIALYIWIIEPLQMIALLYAGRQEAKYGPALDAELSAARANTANGSGTTPKTFPGSKTISKVNDFLDDIFYSGNTGSGNISAAVDDVVPSNPYKGLTDQQVADKFVGGMADITTGVKKNYDAGGGGYSQALKDFDTLGLTDVYSWTEIIEGKAVPMKRGTLPDGTRVVARDYSTSNMGATLEFQLRKSRAGGVNYEVRYGN